MEVDSCCTLLFRILVLFTSSIKECYSILTIFSISLQQGTEQLSAPTPFNVNQRFCGLEALLAITVSRNKVVVSSGIE